MYNPQLLEQLSEVLAANPDGCTFNFLFSKMVECTDTVQLSLLINRASKLGKCFKQNNMYFGVVPVFKEIVKPAPVKEPEPQGKVVVIEQTKTPELPKIEADGSLQFAAKKDKVKKNGEVKIFKTSGTLHRGRMRGKVAYVFYRFRSLQPLKVKDILLQLDDINEAQLYFVLSALVADGYILNISDAAKNEKSWRWSNKYSYPFRDTKETDVAILKYKPAEVADLKTVEEGLSREYLNVWVKEQIRPIENSNQPEVKPESNVVDIKDSKPMSNPELALEMIQFRIRHYQQEIDSLKLIEATLLRA